MRTRDSPKPPKHLSPEAKRLWIRIFEESEMDGPGILLLDTLCQQFDRMQAARELIRKEGMIVVERTAAACERRRIHPACIIETNAAAAMMRAWKLLGFDQLPPEAL